MWSDITEARLRNLIDHNVSKIIQILKKDQGPGVNKISEITEHIRLSPVNSINNKEELLEYNVNTILYFGQKQIKSSLNLICFPVINFKKTLEESYEIINENIQQNNNVLLCCDDGINLSAIFLAHYFLVRYYCLKFKKDVKATKKMIRYDFLYLPYVFSFIHSFRNCILPKEDYIRMLVRIEIEVKKYHYAIIKTEYDNYIKNNQRNELYDSKIEIEDYVDLKYGNGLVEEPISKSEKKKFNELDEIYNL